MELLHMTARLAPVVRLIREAPGASVLDVGSGEATVAAALDRRWSVTAVEHGMPAPLRDHLAAMGATPVDADARSLPFPDRAFDVSVALDVLEHIRPESRADVVREIVRVTRRRVIVGGPVGGAARDGDALMQARYARHGALPVWLREHLDFGPPELEDITGPVASECAIRVCRVQNTYAQVLMMDALNSRLGWHVQKTLARVCRPALDGTGATERLASALLWALRGFDRAPTYRTIVIVDLPGPGGTTSSRSSRQSRATAPVALSTTPLTR